MAAPAVNQLIFVQSDPVKNNGATHAPATVVANLGSEPYTFNGGGTAYQVQALVHLDGGPGQGIRAVLADVSVFPDRSTAFLASSSRHLVAASVA